MKKRLFILVLAAAALVSCEPYGYFDHITFNHERQLWLEQDIQNYSYLFEESGPPGPWGANMYIQDGVLMYIQLDLDVPPTPVEEMEYIPYFFFGNTISDVYDRIETVVSVNGRGYTFEIQYDSEWHYPKHFLSNVPGRGFTMFNIYKFNVCTEVF